MVRAAIAAHGERVAVSLDVRVIEDPGGSPQHRLAARGGTADGGDLWETLERLDRDGCARYVVTDVSRDGTLRGPNVELYRAVTRATTAPVIASGGISSIEDLVVLAEAAAAGANLEGAIVGTALHAGRFTLPEALDAMRRIDVAVVRRLTLAVVCHCRIRGTARRLPDERTRDATAIDTSRKLRGTVPPNLCFVDHLVDTDDRRLHHKQPPTRRAESGTDVADRHGSRGRAT